MKQIMIIDDDMSIGNMLEEALAKANYGVLRAYSGTEALLLLARETPDLILLDLMLPGLSGEQVLEKIKTIPVIIISAKLESSSKVSLLLGGAVDYVTKPFEIKELLARIQVQLRRAPVAEANPVIRAAELTLNANLLEASVNGKKVKLTKTECMVLTLLMSNPHQAISKNALLDKISWEQPDCTEHSLKQHISNLRKKLSELDGYDYIETVWGIGFKFRLKS